MAASLLLAQQKRAEVLGAEYAGSRFRFAVLLAGRAPLVSLDPDLVTSSALVNASECKVEFDGFPSDDGNGGEGEREHVVRLPTIHVHGLQDPGLRLHRRLLDEYCEKGSTRLVEWDGDHRVPIKTKDVAAVVEQILDVANETGVF